MALIVSNGEKNVGLLHLAILHRLCSTQQCSGRFHFPWLLSLYLSFQHNFASVESYDDVDHDIMILAQRKNSQLKIPFLKGALLLHCSLLKKTLCAASNSVVFSGRPATDACISLLRNPTYLTISIICKGKNLPQIKGDWTTLNSLCQKCKHCKKCQQCLLVHSN